MSWKYYLPNGGFYTLSDDITQEQADDAARRKHPELFAPPESTVMGALTSGFKRLGSEARELAEIPFLGVDEAATRAARRERALVEEYGTGASFEDVGKKYEEEGVLSAAGEVARQSAMAIAGTVPYMAELGVGAMAGPVGLAAAAYAPRLASNIERQASLQLEKGEPTDVDVAEAAGYAAPMAALDVAAQAIPLGKTAAGKIFGPEVEKLLTRGAKTEAEKAAADAMLSRRGIWASMASGTGKNLIAQSFIQPAEVAMDRLQSDQELLSDDALAAYGEALYMATIMSPLGAVSGISERSAAKTREFRRAQEKPGIDEETGQETLAPELFTYDEDKWEANRPQEEAVPEPEPFDKQSRFLELQRRYEKEFGRELTPEEKDSLLADVDTEAETARQKEPTQFEEEVGVPRATTPSTEQMELPGFEQPTGGLFGEELLPQRRFDREAEAQQREAGEALRAAREEAPKVEEEAAPETEDMFGEEKQTPDYTPFEGMEGVTHTFSTERGSTYAQLDDGTTIRNRSGANHTDTTTGLQPKSGKTVYVDEAGANKIGGWIQNPDVATQLVPELDAQGRTTGNVQVKLLEDYGPKKAGEVVAITPYTTTPEVGKLPVEIWRSKSPQGDTGRGIHFGNKITEVLGVEDRASRAAEAVGIGQDKYMDLVQAIKIKIDPLKQWITPQFIAKELGLDYRNPEDRSLAVDTLKALEVDDYVGKPNKAGWYKPTEKVETEAEPTPSARMIGGARVAEEPIRRAPMMGGRNIAVEEQRRAPMMGGRNLLAEETENAPAIKANIEEPAGTVGGERLNERGVPTSDERPVQPRGTGEPSTEAVGGERLDVNKPDITEPTEGAGTRPAPLEVKTPELPETKPTEPLSAEDRARLLRMPYVEAKQAMLEANEPNVRWQMAADKLLRERNARRAGIVNETQRLASMAQREAPTRSVRAVESIKSGNLGEALYHLTNEAGGRKQELLPDQAQPYKYNANEVSPLRYLATALFNTVHRGDIGEREQIISAEIARKSEEVRETQNRAITDKEKRDIRNRILNDHKLTKVDVLDTAGKLTPAGRIIYKAGKNGKPVVDEAGNLVRNFTPDSERLVPVTGKARLNTYSGDVETLGGAKIPKVAFAGAEVAVEKARMKPEDTAVFARLKQEGKLAEYNPRENKFYFTEEGLNDRTILHEMTHAATVKVLKHYETEQSRKALTESQRIGAQELHKIYAVAKKHLGDEHANALENIYEFATHAATNKAFQGALAEIPAGKLGTVTRRAQPNLWNMFTRAVARMFGLSHADKKNEGNALLNASQAINDILSTPEKGLDVEPLAEKAGKPSLIDEIPDDMAVDIHVATTVPTPDQAKGSGRFQKMLEDVLERHGEKPAVASIVNMLSRMPVNTFDMWNKAQTLYGIERSYQHLAKSLPTLTDNITMMSSDKTRELIDAEKVTGQMEDAVYSAVKSKGRRVQEEFNGLVDDLTITQADIWNLDAKTHTFTDNPEVAKLVNSVRSGATKVESLDANTRQLYRVASRYYALPKEIRDTARQYFGYFNKLSERGISEAKRLAIDNIKDEELTKKILSKHAIGNLKYYVPRIRAGSYVLRFTSKDGSRYVSQHESPAARAIARKRLTAEGATEFSEEMRNTRTPTDKLVPTGLLGEVLDKVKQNYALSPEVRGRLSEEALVAHNRKMTNVINSIYDGFLEFMPNRVMRDAKGRTVVELADGTKQYGYRGAEQDALKVFKTQVPSIIHQINKVRWGTKLDDAYTEIRKEMRGKLAAGTSTLDEAKTNAVLNDLGKRIEFAKNPTYNKFVNASAKANYYWSIAGNVSSALTNTTVLPMFVAPNLGGKYGTAKTTKAMALAAKLYPAFREFDKHDLVDGEHSAQHKSAFINTLRNMDLSEFGVTANDLVALHKFLLERSSTGNAALHEMRQNQISKSGIEKLSGKVEYALGLAFRETEQFNRGITHLSSFLLDMDKRRGQSDAVSRASREAYLFTGEMNSSAIRETSSSLYQTNWGRALLTFRTFPINMAIQTGKVFKAAVAKVAENDAEARQIRTIARRQLLGIMGMAYAFAGVRGMPLYGMANVLASLFYDNDDEPFDLDQEVIKSIGTVGANGVMSHILGADVANRTGFNGLLWRDDPKRLADVGYANYIVERAFGPTAGILQGFERGMEQWSKGRYERAIEYMVPAVIRNGMKGVRYANEGAKTLNGDSIRDDIGLWDVANQVIGFTPTDISETMTQSSAEKAVDTKLQNRKSILLTKLNAARVAGDTDEMIEIMQEIQHFSAINPGLFGKDTISSSFRQHDAIARQTVNGLYLPQARRLATMQYVADSDDE